MSPFPHVQLVKVHLGFLLTHTYVREAVNALLRTAVAADGQEGHGPSGGESRPWRVVLAGHSLGGALAQLAALDLERQKDDGKL